MIYIEGEIIYAPPPPPPQFRPEDLFQRGGGGYIWKPPAAGLCTRPPSFTINTKICAIQKKFLRGINFVKITKTNIQPPPPPKETKNTTHGSYKKNLWPQRIPVKIKKIYKKKPGGELICKNFGVNGICPPTPRRVFSRGWGGVGVYKIWPCIIISPCRKRESWRESRKKSEKKKEPKAGFKKALRPFSVERPKSRSGAYSGRFGSDSGAPPGRISDFWPVTPTFAL